MESAQTLHSAHLLCVLGSLTSQRLFSRFEIVDNKWYLPLGLLRG